MKQETWILGAPDPEMEAIEAMLREQGKTVAYATYWGKRVTARNAYQADGPVSSGHVCLVECDIPALQTDVRRIDHHREGDPGYDLGPDQFLPASSIGQVLAAIHGGEWVYRPGHGWSLEEGGTVLYAPPEVILLVAASDHCPLDGYRGHCPGVSPEQLAEWRLETRAKFQRRSVAELKADVAKARAELRKAELVFGAPGDVRNLLGHAPIPELPEAALQEGVAFMATVPRGAEKQIVLQCATPAQVEWFLRHYPVDRKYGVPARGFAGGYMRLGAL